MGRAWEPRRARPAASMEVRSPHRVQGAHGAQLSPGGPAGGGGGGRASRAEAGSDGRRAHTDLKFTMPVLSSSFFISSLTWCRFTGTLSC